MLAQLLTLLLVAGSVVACHRRPLRSLAPERRLLAVTGLSLVPLLALRLLGGSPGTSLPLAADAPPHAQALVAIATLATAMALALLWHAILDDCTRSAARIAVAVLGSAFALLSLSSVSFWPWIALPVALRCGWIKTSPEKTLPAALTGFFGLAIVLNWPNLPSPAACWPPGCHLGLPLIRAARGFLIVQTAVISLRLMFRLIFGPRRIGRRLLVSHMMAGAVPVALIGLFLVLVALLALANLRAATGRQLLIARHAASQQILAGIVKAATQSGEDVDVSALGRAVASQWSSAAGWDPSPESRVFLSLSFSAAPALGETLLATLRPPILMELDRSAGLGRPAPLDSEGRTPLGLPPAQAWAERPRDPEDLGLVKSHGVSFHAADCVAPLGTGDLRVQLIEQLPYGRVRILEEFLGELAWLEERMRFTCLPSNSSASGNGAAIHLLETDSLVAAPTAPRKATSYRSSYTLVSAQEWLPAGASLAVADAQEETGGSATRGRERGNIELRIDDRSARTRRVTLEQPRWVPIRLPVLGISTLRDLIPPVPALRENPLSALPFVILFGTALLFVAVEAVAFGSALRIGSAIADSVRILRAGTGRLQTGDLSYRIHMRGDDELTHLGEAFNAMAVGLEAGRRAALEKERLEGELEVARRIQQRLLPATPPQIARLQIAGLSEPARQVGGDYYDLLRLPDGRLLFTLADVSGKGVPAALLMSSVRAALHSIVIGEEDLIAIIGRLNRFIHGSTAATEFVTLFLGTLDGATGTLRYVNAGHEPPCLLRAGGTLERLSDTSLILGAFPGVTYQESRAELHSGDTLFLFTDGLSEAQDPDEEMFGDGRIAAALQDVAGGSPEDLLQTMVAQVRRFERGAEASDDITLLAIRRTAE